MSAHSPGAGFRRRAVGTALAGLGLATLAACGGSSADVAGSGDGDTPDAAALKAAGPTTVTLWHGLGGAAGEALDQAIEDYNADNSDGITVKAVYQGDYADALAKYTTAIRDGSTPEIMLASDTSTGFLEDAGQTISAQELSEANPEDLDLDELRPAARNYYSVDGELQSVPFNTSMPMLYVNDDLLDQAGIDPDDLTTFEAMDAAARTIHEKNPDVYGIVQPNADGWWLEQFTAVSGELYCTPDNGRAGASASAVSLDGSGQLSAFQTMADLMTDGVGLNVGDDSDAALSAFTSGKVAMMFNSSGAIGTLSESGTTGYTALPVPLNSDSDDAGVIIGGASMWVDAVEHTAAEQAASWKVVSYLASADVQEEFSHASGYAPINTAVDDSTTQQEFLDENPVWKAVIDEFDNTPASTATAGCLSGALPSVRGDVIAELDAAYRGTTSVTDAVAAATEKADQSIGDYLEQVGE